MNADVAAPGIDRAHHEPSAQVGRHGRDQIETAPDIGVRWRSEYISGDVRREDGFVVLVDLGRLLSSNEAAALASADIGHAA